MVKEIKHDDKVFKVEVKDSTETVQRDWSSGLFNNRSVLNFIKSVYKGGSIIDIGSEIGNNTLFFGGVLGAMVYTIEPDGLKTERLVKNIMRNNLTTNVLQMAVSNYSGIARMDRGHGIVFLKEKKDLADVRVTTVDSVIFETNISLMYIDVKGQANNILSGCRRAIRCNLPDLFIRTDSPEKVVKFLKEKFNVQYEVKYQFNESKPVFYLKPIKTT